MVHKRPKEKNENFRKKILRFRSLIKVVSAEDSFGETGVTRSAPVTFAAFNGVGIKMIVIRRCSI